MANNALTFPQSDKTLKGFRAYFQINATPSAAPIRGARIITQGQIATDIDLVLLEDNKAVKTIENGQLVIIRDGIRYNAMGTVIK